MALATTTPHWRWLVTAAIADGDIVRVRGIDGPTMLVLAAVYDEHHFPSFSKCGWFDTAHRWCDAVFLRDSLVLARARGDL